jgi:putative helix-turn-helix protein
MNISRAIRFLRKQKGWTQQQLADFANTSKSNISNLENGNQGYSEAILKYLADALGCRDSSIFLLAEYLERQQNNTLKDLEEMPVELIFLQLPEPLQQSFKLLMIQTLEQISK